MKKCLLGILLILISFIPLKTSSWETIKCVEADQTSEETVYVEEQPTTTQTTTTTTKKKITTTTAKSNHFTGYLTHYGPDCKGCSGITASGYDVRNTIYYNDSEYGQVRIVAASKKYPFYTILRLNDYKTGSIIAIVLDRGGAIKGNKLDLLTSSNSEAASLWVQNVDVDVLRWGKAK